MDIEECESDDALGMQLGSNASDERDLSPGVFAGEDGGGSEDTAEQSPSGDLPADCEDDVFQLGQSESDRAPSDAMALDESEAEGSASFQCSESEDPDSLRAPTWRPGWNCGEWIRGKRSFGEQAQVLITNVYLNLRLLPNTLAAAVLAHLSPGRQVKKTTRRTSCQAGCWVCRIALQAQCTIGSWAPGGSPLRRNPVSLTTLGRRA